MDGIIAICSQKGGVGKTTLALNLGLALAELGVPATVVELDPQGCLADSLTGESDLRAGLMAYLEGRSGGTLPLVPTRVQGLTLLPAGEIPPENELDFEDLVSEDERFAAVLAACGEAGSRLVLLDCPSGFGTIVQAALRQASGVLIPVQAEPLALRGLGRFLSGIESVRTETNPALTLLGLVVMMLDKGSDTSLSVLTSAWGAFDPAVVCETVIPRRDEFLRASLLGVPVAFLGRRTHPEARRFQALALEVLERLEWGAKEEDEDADAIRTLV